MKFKLIGVDIKEFKGVKSQSYKQVLGCRNSQSNNSQFYDVVAIFGENGSGKTTIAESIKFLFSPGKNKYKNFDIRYWIECIENNQKATIRITLKRGIIDKEKEIFCLTCKSDNCIHASKLRHIIENFQEIAIERESSSLNLYFYHRFSGDRVEFNLNNLKKLLFNITGVKNIENKIQDLIETKKRMERKLTEAEEAEKAIEDKFNKITELILQRLEEVEKYSDSLYSRLNRICDEIIYLIPRRNGNITVETQSYEVIKKDLTNIIKEIESLISSLEERKTKLKTNIHDSEHKKEEYLQKEKKLSEQIEKLENRKRKLENNLHNKDYLLNDDLKKELLEINEDYARLQKEKEELEKRIKDYKEEIVQTFHNLYNICTFHISPKNLDLTNAELQNSNHKELLETYKNYISESENKFKNWKLEVLNKIEKTKLKLDDINHEIDKLVQEVQNKDQEIITLKERLESTQLNIDTLISKKQEKIRKEIGEINEELEKLRESSRDIKNTVNELDNKMRNLKNESEKISRAITKIKIGKNLIDFLLEEDILRQLSKDYKAVINEYRRLKGLIQLSNCLITYQIINLETLRDRILKKLTDYISEKATNYFNFLTEHERFREIKILYEGENFFIKVKDILDNKYKLIREMPDIMNGQAIASLNLSLQVSTLELIKDALEDTFSLLILDDPTQAFDNKRKINFVNFLQKLVNNGIQVVILTFDEVLLAFNNQVEGMIAELLSVPVLVEKINYAITSTNDPIIITESFIEITECKVLHNSEKNAVS